MSPLTLYVPRSDSELHDRIWSGSGIVGSPVGDTGRIRLDFEGDTSVYPAYKDRVRRAAERHEWSDGERSGYPTRACAHVSKNEVIPIGTYDPATERLVVDDPPALRAWLDGEELPDSTSG